MESIISQIALRFNPKRVDFKETRLGQFLLKSFYILMFLMIVCISFLLGRITKFLEARPSFSYEMGEEMEGDPTTKLFSATQTVSTSTIVASSGGKKYYFVWCKGVSNLKESNKIYFATEDLAKKAGYTLANNCK